MQKLKKKYQELRTAQENRSEENAQKRHELYLFELEDLGIEARNQAEERREEADEWREEADEWREEAKKETHQLQLQLAALQSGEW